MRHEEWDWPPRRRRYQTYSRFDVYQPNDWDWPIRKKIIDIGWRVMIITLKVILMSALTILAFGASWLIVIVLTL